MFCLIQYTMGGIPMSIEEVGGNTGNLVFIQAIKESIAFDEEAYLSSQWTRENKGKADIVSIMPASNFLSENAKWTENYIPILEQTDMKFTFVGLGVQASLQETPKTIIDKLSERQKYLYKLVRESKNYWRKGRIYCRLFEQNGNIQR